MNFKTVALLHPGNMGATIGAAAATSGARSFGSRTNAVKPRKNGLNRMGLVDVKNLTDAVRESGVHSFSLPARRRSGSRPERRGAQLQRCYVDANAISRTTAEIGRTVSKGGASFVDGGMIGAPVKQAGTTRLYLSGSRAPEIAELFSASMSNRQGHWSNPRCRLRTQGRLCGWTKCTDGLVLAIRALAAIEGVDQALSEEWSISQPDLARKSTRAAAVAAPKAWRYVGEMKEIAESFAAAGLTPGFHDAAADIWERLAPFKDRTDPPPTLEEVIDALCRSCDKLR